ncbi:MAG: hypothetical protein KAI24_10545, partial [Planctomycetes bacterium]|nr:hypothetical protein [Planctomycetota bacterium]
MRLISAAITGLSLTAAITAQSPLTTTFAGGNGQAGNMFDLVATNAAGVTIKNFDVNLDAGTWDLEVYKLTTPGPYLPSVTNPADWTLVCAVSSVVSAGPNVPTLLPLSVEEFIPSGATQSFYVTVTNGTAINYTNGTTTGALFASNADLEFYEGAGMSYPFGSNFNPRVFNGNIYYDVGNTAGPGAFPCIVPPRMVGVAETTPFTGTLNQNGGSFVDGDFLRFNYDDAFGSYPSAPALTVLNYGVGAPPPVGVTAFIPGFDQLWAGSTPSGYAEIVTATIGDPDVLAPIPAGLFGVGDVVRIQGIVLDLTGTTLPDLFVPTPNTLSFVKVPSCILLEDFESVTPGLGSYPVGWANGGGIREWTADINGTTSGGTGPSTGSLGSAVYMYCETSSPSVTGDTYIMNTDTYSLAGATSVGFDLSRIGATIGTLEVRMDDGTGT